MNLEDNSLLGKWNRYWFSPVSADALGLSRIYFFAAISWLMWNENIGLWDDVTRLVWWPMPLFKSLGLKPISMETAFWFHLIFKTGLVFSCIGLFTRTSCIVTTLMTYYIAGLPNCFCGKINHGYTLPLLLMATFALSRAGDAWSVDNLLRKRFGWPQPPKLSGQYNWPVKLMGVIFALVFFGAGYSKLYRSGLDWIFSENFSNLLLMHHYYKTPPLDWGLWIAQHQWLCVLMALAAVVFELAAPLGLINKYLRAMIYGSLFLMQIGIWQLIGVKFLAYFLCYPMLLPWDLISQKLRALLSRFQNSSIEEA